VPEYLKKHPVIIVPGFLGSAFVPATGRWELDPILHTYDDLYASLVDSGLVPEEDIFVFPYQWRNSNVYTATLLAKKITEVKQITGADKVDIIAHSMGGLVTRIYAQSDTYANDINNIFFLGTPQLGSSKAFPIWEAGYTGYEDVFFGIFLSFILKEESITNGYFGNNGVVNYIRSEVTSIGQLLPTYSYVNFGGGVVKGPENNFLNELNNNKHILTARGIHVTNIVGNTGSTTIRGFTLGNTNSLPAWEFGEPIGLALGDRYSGVTFTEGDSTVTLDSQSFIDGQNIILTGIEHNKLPDYSSAEIGTILGLSMNAKITTQINELLMINVYSPVDFYVLAPDGKRIGFNKDGVAFNEIEGAFYTGNDSETEFITIPNPLSGEYKVITQGTGTGSYEIEVTFADDESNIAFSDNYFGETTLGKEADLPFVFSSEQQSIKIEKQDDSIKQKEELVSSNTNDDLTIVSTSQAPSIQGDVVSSAHPDMSDVTGLEDVLGRSQESNLVNENTSTKDVNTPMKRKNIFSTNNLAVLLIILILIELVIVKYRTHKKN